MRDLREMFLDNFDGGMYELYDVDELADDGEV